MDTSTFKKGQLESIQHLDGPLLICAGAGSGKTFTLTQRITAALLPGSGKDGGAFLQSIDQALIITFTNAAASGCATASARRCAPKAWRKRR